MFQLAVIKMYSLGTEKKENVIYLFSLRIVGSRGNVRSFLDSCSSWSIVRFGLRANCSRSNFDGKMYEIMCCVKSLRGRFLERRNEWK